MSRPYLNNKYKNSNSILYNNSEIKYVYKYYLTLLFLDG